MSNATIAITEGVGKLLDAEQVTVSSLVTHRQRIQVAGATDIQVAAVFNGAPGSNVQALCVRQAGPVGQDHGVVITPEIGYSYVKGKDVRSPMATLPFLQIVGVGGVSILGGVVNTNVFIVHMAVSSSVDLAFAIRSGTLADPVIYYVMLKAGYPFSIAASAGSYLCMTTTGKGIFLSHDQPTATLYGTLGYIQV